MSGLLRSVQAALVGDREVSLYELLYTMKLGGSFLNAFAEALRLTLALEAADREGITTTADEVQAEADAARRDVGLSNAGETRLWLRRRGWLEEDFEESMRRRVLIRKLRKSVIRHEIRPYFEAHRGDFESEALDRPTATRIATILWERWLAEESERRNSLFTLPGALVKR